MTTANVPDPSPSSARVDLSAVEADLGLQALEIAGMPYRVPRRMPAVLRWDPADPWAVALDFPRDERVWVFGWELLARAAGTPWPWPAGHRVGGGDLQVRRPTVLGFELRLSSPDGSAVLCADAWDVAAFVTAVRPRQAAAVLADLPDTVIGFLDLCRGRRRGGA